MKETGFCEFALYALEQHFALTQKDLGADARMSAKGITFATEAWEIEGIGHLCIMKMRAFFGLMRMETVVISPTHVDMPLINIDWVKAFGNETQMVELYDTQLQPWPAECSNVFERLLERDADLPDAPGGGERWYSDILYPCSYRKRGKGLTGRLSIAAQDYIVSYVDQLADAAVCDERAKAAKVRSFATRLFDEGGPAVDQVVRLFGRPTARRLVVRHMYGADE
ncbi:MAG: hypothetical protein IJ087_21570 [Eggerthellaceae bacterium]|nr:hypothetical protein [Eggerthellaceae bacterium]